MKRSIRFVLSAVAFACALSAPAVGATDPALAGKKALLVAHGAAKDKAADGSTPQCCG